jgi:hypothetical protein
LLAIFPLAYGGRGIRIYLPSNGEILMRAHLRFSIWFGAAFLALLLLACRAEAQCSAASIGFMNVGVTPTNPFQAEILITPVALAAKTLFPDRPPLIEKVARDSQGRVRIEHPGGQYQVKTGPDAGTQVEQRIIIDL